VLCESGCYEVGVHLRELLREARARIHQHFKPHTEAIGVELLVAPRLLGAPQVEIEDARQLFGGRQCHELAAILEAATLNHPMQDLGWKLRDDVREVWCVENALEQRALVAGVPQRRGVVPVLKTTSTMFRFWHGPVMIPAHIRKKQSCSASPDQGQYMWGDILPRIPNPESQIPTERAPRSCPR
jgi:hypothetical protein